MTAAGRFDRQRDQLKQRGLFARRLFACGFFIGAASEATVRFLARRDGAKLHLRDGRLNGGEGKVVGAEAFGWSHQSLTCTLVIDADDVGRDVDECTLRFAQHFVLDMDVIERVGLGAQAALLAELDA